MIEEQFRLTLHMHILIWLQGHNKIEDQLNELISDTIIKAASELNVTIQQQLPDVSKFTNNYASYLDSFIAGEVLLPEPESKSVLHCPRMQTRKTIGHSFN